MDPGTSDAVINTHLLWLWLCRWTRSKSVSTNNLTDSRNRERAIMISSFPRWRPAMILSISTALILPHAPIAANTGDWSQQAWNTISMKGPTCSFIITSGPFSSRSSLKKWYSPCIEKVTTAATISFAEARMWLGVQDIAFCRPQTRAISCRVNSQLQYSAVTALECNCSGNDCRRVKHLQMFHAVTFLCNHGPLCA